MRCARDILKTSHKRHLFKIFLRCLKDVTKNPSFLTGIWEVLKTLQKSHLFWDVSKRSLRCLSQWRSDWDLSKTSHAGWEGDITSNSSEIFEKYLWRILFLVKFQTYSLQFIQKINFSTGTVHEFCLLFSNIYLNEHLEWLLSFISIVRLHKGVYIP